MFDNDIEKIFNVEDILFNNDEEFKTFVEESGKLNDNEESYVTDDGMFIMFKVDGRMEHCPTQKALDTGHVTLDAGYLPYNSLGIDQEEYHSFRLRGYSHIEAKNRAIDYHRKNTQKELTTMAVGEYDIHSNGDLTSEDSLAFNDLFDVLMNGVDGVAQKMVACLIVNIGVDKHLSEDRQKIVEELTENYESTKDLMCGGIGEIATALGVKPSSNKYYDIVNTMRKLVGDTLDDHELNTLGEHDAVNALNLI